MKVNKWSILAAYAIVVASSQMLWLTFASDDSLLAPLMHTSADNIILLSLIFPLTYIILAIPMSRWLDRKFVPAITFGAAFNAAGSVMRLADPGNFIYQMASQTIISIGQPLILGSLSIVAVYYFEERERPLAISIGSLAIFLGIIAATFAGPSILSSEGYVPMLAIEAIPGVIGFVWLVLSLGKPERKEEATGEERGFRYTRFHYKLAFMLFVGMGLFDALESILNPMLAVNGLGNSAAGILTLMTLAGVFGAAIIPQFLSEHARRKPVVSVIIVLSIISLIVIGYSSSLTLIALTLGVEGFFLLAGLPVLLEWAESATSAQNQAKVTNLLMLSGNAGGLVMIAMGFVLQPIGNSITSLSLMIFVLLLIPVLVITPALAARPVPVPD